MIRKKFIKMLMHAGMSRNDAADCATLSREARRPYYWVLGDLLNFHRQDFGNPLAWIKMRHTIIHGHGTPAHRFFSEIDEASKMDGSQVAAVLEAGMAPSPRPVVIINPGYAAIDWSRFDWPPQPQPAAGCLHAINTGLGADMIAQFQRENPNGADLVDALRYAVEEMDYRQRGVLGQ